LREKGEKLPQVRRGHGSKKPKQKVRNTSTSMMRGRAEIRGEADLSWRGILTEKGLGTGGQNEALSTISW